ncbi:restriction endonuclease [Burkholderia gladioli]|uniref:restriction endonuclease n=1 Tax=Burkholderia gladioli TaxID=28095 RepID=UPI0015611856|nr:restriction endonuclease [Burkholderia gladioli]NRF85546.1 restriction endonuclease [Burkholderia gladioli]
MNPSTCDHVDHPGISFEKVVAAIQAQLDPAASVTHNEVLVDRLGHSRQFDVVVRGVFAGQKMLGVIECKDLNKKVGTPEVDGFITKASDVNANFKILVSRKGFSKPGLSKCCHYGIQPLSLVDDDLANKNFFVGTRWEADITRWGRIAVTLHFANQPTEAVHFSADELTVRGKKVFDWFTNYLLDKEAEITELGRVVNIIVQFEELQTVSVRPGEEYLCTAISFSAERICDKLERLVGISGTGFFDWNSKMATFPPGTEIRTDAVPMDFSQWKPRSDRRGGPSGFLEVRLEACSVQFERMPDAIELDRL